MSDLHLYIYDLSKGMARQYSALFLGKHFDGVWHTGVVAFGKEWYFGNDGIDCCEPKGTILGEPNEILHLGKTELNEEDFVEVVRQMSQSSYKVGTYNLLEHNCNNFSNDLSLLLVGKPIPEHIIDLPRQILNTSLGPMLRPLLEQAADPVHQFKNGHTPFSKLTSVASSASQSSSTETPLPSMSIVFKPNASDEFKSLVNHCKEKSLLSSSDLNLLNEIADYLKQEQITWSISNNHLNLLFKIHFEIIQNSHHNLTVLKALQLISLHKDTSLLLVKNNFVTDKLIDHIKNSDQPDIQYLSLQMLSNVCTNHSSSKYLLEKHQDKLFKELSEFTLIQANSDLEVLINEASISFFFNMISAYHLESHLNDSNALTLGCALMETLPKFKSKAKSIYQILSLLRSCLSKSQNMRDLAVSMDFDLNKYKQQQMSSASNGTKNDSYDSIIKNIDELLHINGTNGASHS